MLNTNLKSEEHKIFDDDPIDKIAKIHFIIELRNHALEDQKDQRGNSVNIISFNIYFHVSLGFRMLSNSFWSKRNCFSYSCCNCLSKVLGEVS